MVKDVEDFYRIANRILHNLNPQAETVEDAQEVLKVLKDMKYKLRKVKDGRYRDVIMEYFATHPALFENVFRKKVQRYVPVGEYVIDLKAIFELRSEYTYQFEAEPKLYRRLKNKRYLLSNNGILYDMKFHHKEKMYTSKDGIPIYYLEETKPISVKKLIEGNFEIDERPCLTPTPEEFLLWRNNPERIGEFSEVDETYD